jgi:hypothetical protein
MQDFDLEQQLIQNRMKRFGQQGYQEPQGQMIGNQFVAPNVFQHLAAGLRGYGAIKGTAQAEQELKDLQGKRQTAIADALRNFGDKSRGAEAFTAAGPAPEGQDQTGGYNVPARAPDMRGAYADLMAAPDASLRQAGMQGMIQMPQLEAAKLAKEEERQFRKEEADATRQARMDALAQQHQDRMAALAQQHQDRMAALEAANTSRQQMAQEQRQFQMQMAQMNMQNQREMRQLTEANRPPKPAGADWKYDAGSDAWVKPPSAEFPLGQTTPNAGKAASLKNFDYLATNMMGEDGESGVIAKTAQGGYFGLGGALGSGTQAAKEFDNTVEQMSTELRTVFRIPGEGALSDKEQAQYGIQLPKRGNDAALNRKIITDLKVRMGNRVNPQGVSPAQTPTTTGTTPIYASNGTQRIVSNDGGKTWQPAK